MPVATTVNVAIPPSQTSTFAGLLTVGAAFNSPISKSLKLVNPPVVEIVLPATNEGVEVQKVGLTSYFLIL